MYGLVVLGSDYNINITLNPEELFRHSYNTLEDAQEDFLRDIIKIFSHYKNCRIPKSIDEIELRIPDIVDYQSHKSFKLSHMSKWKHVFPPCYQVYKFAILSYYSNDGLNLSFHSLLVNLNIFDQIKITFDDFHF